MNSSAQDQQHSAFYEISESSSESGESSEGEPYEINNVFRYSDMSWLDMNNHAQEALK